MLLLKRDNFLTAHTTHIAVHSFDVFADHLALTCQTLAFTSSNGSAA